MPELAAKRFRWAADKQGQAVTVVAGPRSPGKVAIFATCYVNYNAPGIGHDRVRVPEHNAFPFVIVENGSGRSLGCSRWGSVVAFGAGARPR